MPFRHALNACTLAAMCLTAPLAMSLAQGADAIASARTAALVDPEGEGLAKCLAEIASRTAAPRMAAE